MCMQLFNKLIKSWKKLEMVAAIIGFADQLNVGNKSGLKTREIKTLNT